MQALTPLAIFNGQVACLLGQRGSSRLARGNLPLKKQAGHRYAQGGAMMQDGALAWDLPVSAFGEHTRHMTAATAAGWTASPTTTQLNG